MPSKDIGKRREASRRHYLKNTEAMKARAANFNKAARARNRDFVRNYLTSHPCIDCGVSDIRVLEFDHVRGEKIAAVSSMAKSHSCSVATIMAEIEKCDVRCANCHRIMTHNRRLTPTVTKHQVPACGGQVR